MDHSCPYIASLTREPFLLFVIRINSKMIWSHMKEV